MKHYWLTITYLEDEDEDDDKILINATATSTQQFMKTTSVFKLWRVKKIAFFLSITVIQHDSRNFCWRVQLFSLVQ